MSCGHFLLSQTAPMFYPLSLLCFHRGLDLANKTILVVNTGARQRAGQVHCGDIRHRVMLSLYGERSSITYFPLFIHLSLIGWSVVRPASFAGQCVWRAPPNDLSDRSGSWSMRTTPVYNNSLCMESISYLHCRAHVFFLLVKLVASKPENRDQVNRQLITATCFSLFRERHAYVLEKGRDVV